MAEQNLAVLCSSCPHGEDYFYPELIAKLVEYMAMLEAGCPVGRHELYNEEWLLIGMLKAEEYKIAKEQAAKRKIEGAGNG